jgi:hypothetical protein
MAKISGLGWPTFSIDDSGGTPRDIHNDTTNIQFATPRGVQDTTGLDKSANERLLLLADFSITANGVFNPTANASHSVYRTVPSTSVERTTALALASQTLSVEVLYTDYQLNRAADGSFVWTVPGVLANGAVPTWGP